MTPFALLLAAAAAAAAPLDIPIEREEWRVLGWNDACSVAFTRLAFPKLGAAIREEPVMTRVGTISVAPGEEHAKTAWSLEADGKMSWDRKAYEKAIKDLEKAGYTRKGFSETIRAEPMGSQPGLAELLLSTASLRIRRSVAWPGEGWRWIAAYYNPLSTCALVVMKGGQDAINHRFIMLRSYDPRARIERARAHTSNARLLLDMGELEAAAAEAENGATLAPELAVTRYHNAAFLAMTGRAPEAIKELEQAFKIDPSYRLRAKDDRDFAELHERKDFRRLVGAETMLEKLDR